MFSVGKVFLFFGESWANSGDTIIKMCKKGWGKFMQRRDFLEIQTPNKVSSLIFTCFFLNDFSLEWLIVTIHTSLSSSSKVNSFFLTTLSWLRKLNSAAFFCNLANLFSYLETFFNVGLTLKLQIAHFFNNLARHHQTKEKTYNLPRRSLTWAFRSEICCSSQDVKKESLILEKFAQYSLNLNIKKY